MTPNQDDSEVKQDVDLVCDDTFESKAEPLEVKPLEVETQKIAYRAQIIVPLVVFGMGALFSCVCAYAAFALIPKHLNGILEIGFGLGAVFFFLISIVVLLLSAYAAVRSWDGEKLHEKIMSSAAPFAAAPKLKMGKWTKFELECEAGEHPFLAPGLRVVNFIFGVLSVLLGSVPGGPLRVTLVFDDISSKAKIETPLEAPLNMPMFVALNLKKHPDKKVLCVVHPDTKQPYAVLIDERIFFVS